MTNGAPQALADEGFRVLRFWNNDVLENIEGVVESIMEALRQPPSPQPSPIKNVRGSKKRPLT